MESYNEIVPRMKTLRPKPPKTSPKPRRLTEEEMDEIDNLIMDERLRSEKPIPLATVLKRHGRVVDR